MIGYRVTYVEIDGEEQRNKRWSTVEEARAFIVGLKRGAPVKTIKLFEIVEGQKPERIPNTVKIETSAALDAPLILEAPAGSTQPQPTPEPDLMHHHQGRSFRRSSSASQH